MVKRSTLVIGLMILTHPAFAPSKNLYEVVPGDTLSSIAARKLGLPVYGPDGSLHRLLQQNPQVKNPDMIVAGEQLSLPAAPSSVQTADADQPHGKAESAKLAAGEQASEAAPRAAEIKDGLPDTAEKKIIAEDASYSDAAALEVKVEFFSVDALITASGGKRRLNTQLHSSEGYGARMELGYVKMRPITPMVMLEGSKVSFKDSADRSIYGNSHTLKSLNLGVRYQLATDLTSSLSLGARQNYHIAGLAGDTSLKLEPAFSDTLNIGLSHRIIESRLFGLDHEFVLSSLSEANGDDALSETGWSIAYRFDALLYPQKDYSRLMGLYLQKRVQPAAEVRQQQYTTGIMLGCLTDF
jgi:hypothetical protein